MGEARGVHGGAKGDPGVPPRPPLGPPGAPRGALFWVPGGVWGAPNSGKAFSRSEVPNFHFFRFPVGGVLGGVLLFCGFRSEEGNLMVAI